MAKTPANQDLMGLIQDRIQGRSYAQLSRDCRFSNRSTVQRLATKPLKDMPSTDTLKGLARGLNVTLGAVVSAAAVSVGLDPRNIGASDLIITGARTLPAESQELLLSMAEQMLIWDERVSQAENERDKATPPGGTKSNVRRLHPVQDESLDLEAGAADSSGSRGDGGNISHDDLPESP